MNENLRRAENISLLSAMFSFTIWILLFFDGADYSDNLNHNSSIVSDIEWILWLMAIFLLIFFIIICIFKKKSIMIFRILLFGLWTSFWIIQFPIFLPNEIDPLITIKIKLAILINLNYWLFFLIGIISLSYLSMCITKKIAIIIDTKEFVSSEFVIPLLLCMITSFLHNYLQALNLEYLIIIILALYSIFLHFNILYEKESYNNREIENSETFRQFISIKSVSRHSALLHFFIFSFNLLLFYAISLVSNGTMYYYSSDISMGIFILGIILAFSLFNFMDIKRNIAKSNYIRPIIYYFIGIIVVIIHFSIQLLTLEFSNSTYETNLPLHISSFIGGLAIGIIAFSIKDWYINYKPFDIEKKPLKDNILKFKSVQNYVFRNILLYGLIFAIFYGLYDGIKNNNFNDDYGNTIMIGLYVLVFLSSILLISIVFMFKKKKLLVPNTNKSQNMIKLRDRLKILSNIKNNSIKFNKISAIFLIFVMIFSIFSIAPLFIPTTANSVGYPNHIGYKNGCAITEVSSFSKISKLTLLQSTRSSNENPIIRRSLAKNEFETIQIIISNWGISELEVLNVSISNSTYNGLNTAFSQSDIIKSWKGEEWVWKRFNSGYVEEIVDGYPNLIYDLNGIQTHVKLTPDMNKSRPRSIAKPYNSISLWLTIYAGDDLIGGNYSDEIIIETNKWVHNVTLLTKIWNFTLPTEHSFRTAIGNRVVYNFENRDDWNKIFLNHRISPYFPYVIYDSYIVNETENSVEFNFTKLEYDLNNSINHGLDSFRITFKPTAIIPGAFTVSFNQTTLSFYYQLGNFLGNKTVSWDLSKTWLDLALVYAMDEPSESEYILFNSWSDLVHQAHSGWKVLLTEQVEPEINETVDIWCPHINSVDTSNIKAQKDAGREFWYYTCCHIVDQPTVSFIDPAADHRALFWTGYAFDFDGFLFWDAAAYVNREVYDYYRVGYDGIGDAIMLVSDSNDLPINTIVWDTMRDGLEDVEYFNLLKSLSPNNDILKKIVEDWSNFYSYLKDYTQYLAIRNQIGNIIDNLM